MRVLKFILLLLFISLNVEGKSNSTKTFNKCTDPEKLDELEKNFDMKTNKSNQSINYVVIRKSFTNGESRAYSFHGNELIRVDKVTYGRGGPGIKMHRDDKKTPEGIYNITTKKTKTAYHRAIELDYPTKEDQLAKGSSTWALGDHIQIHGIGSYKGTGPQKFGVNWTTGCIAMDNKAIEAIFQQTITQSTKIEICPATNIAKKLSVSLPNIADFNEQTNTSYPIDTPRTLSKSPTGLAHQINKSDQNNNALLAVEQAQQGIDEKINQLSSKNRYQKSRKTYKPNTRSVGTFKSI